MDQEVKVHNGPIRYRVTHKESTNTRSKDVDQSGSVEVLLKLHFDNHPGTFACGKVVYAPGDPKRL